jgi:SAM-dependent methyltransferase
MTGTNGDLPTESLPRALAFVTSAVQGRPRAVLDIGSGNGALAALLSARSWSVECVESSADAANACRDRGIPCTTGTWPDVPLHKRYDVALLIHSLHHMGPLDAAVVAVKACLDGSGTVVVMDSRYREVGTATRDWFAMMTETAAREGWFNPAAAPARLASRVASHDRAAWDEGAHHRHHSADAIRNALSQVGAVEESRGAYLYRYLEQVIPPGPDRLERIRRFIREEETAIDAGTIEAMEVRFVVR